MTARFFFKGKSSKNSTVVGLGKKIDNCIEKKETSTKGNFKKKED